ncbi:MAG: cation:proton antiporter [Chloroflexi bacterium]|uniref:Cation:proton antiporter n=1 Tax=Candidatus Chlorohelix allophototropha TaxID=3003348 RepID=A0A8T7M7Z3_9CHLR|nr:cation:proton antiporter [Chloroflexota bacterium]WJW68108.1 cation:proton antiporter [Chloroflexota bacterium L227-S17]
MGWIAGIIQATDSGSNYNLITALVLAVIAAVVGGLVAAWLKQPLIIGYLLGGVFIGPYTPGPALVVSDVEVLAEIGVALLMFALGTEFSLQELRHIGKTAVLGGIFQISLTILLGIPVGMLLGLNLSSSIFLGGLLAISSSIVILKILMGRGEMESLHGKVALGLGIVQDLSVIVLVVLLPALGEKGGDNLALSIGLALLKGTLFLVGAYIVGTRFMPWIVQKLVMLGMREMFLLGVITIALGTASLAYFLDISFALGAFVAGLMVSGSESAGDILTEIIPIRDVFASLFFVSIGMLIDPVFLVNNFPEIMLLVITVLIGKWALTSGILLLFKQPLKTAALAGLLLAQVGEFSFVLARIGVDSRAINSRVESLLLSAALVTIIANPLLLQFFPTLTLWLTQLRTRLFRLLGKAVPGYANAGVSLPVSLRPLVEEKEAGEMLYTRRGLRGQTERWPYKKHVVVCGYGRVGQQLVDACMRRNFDVVVIEYNPRRLELARKRGIIGLFGDASVEVTLKQANITEAKVLAITVPDAIVAEAASRAGRAMNPQLEIITRATEQKTIEMLKNSGADEVIQPEFEASLEFIRRTAKLYGVSGVELQALINGRRARFYGRKDM